MKRLLFILLFIPILGFSQYTSIPDQGFEQTLINFGYDNILDGQVLTSNINYLTDLNLATSPGIQTIYSLEGIEDFVRDFSRASLEIEYSVLYEKSTKTQDFTMAFVQLRKYHA